MNDNKFVNMAFASFYYQKNYNSHMLKWNSFKCIHVTVIMSDDQR